MATPEAINALENIHNKNYKTTAIKSFKDWWIQGIQLNKCYTEHWGEIKDIFRRNNLNLNKYSPILTMNELEMVKSIEKISCRDDVEFIAMLHTFPIWCIKNHLISFEKWFKENRSLILSFRGTELEIDEQIKDIIG